MSNALTQLPRLLAWLDKSMTPAPWEYKERQHSGWNAEILHPTRSNSWITIAEEENIDSGNISEVSGNWRGIATLRNMLPALVEMARRFDYLSDCDELPFAQRILDAARAVLTPEQYAEAVKE